MVRSLRAKPASSLTSGKTLPTPPPQYLVYSTAIEGDMSRMLGRPHYSYRFAEAKFLDSFARAGVAPHLLRMPEYYATREALAPAGGLDPAAKLIHLIFRSTEQIRVLHPGYNIACFAWEFQVLKDWTGPNEHPFVNQVHMLSICEEVWAPCRFTRDVLVAHGIRNVHVVPAPVAAPASARLTRIEALVTIGQVTVMPLHLNLLLSDTENARRISSKAQSLVDWLAPKITPDRDTKIYLAIFNPDDYRKNIDSLLRGFEYFQRSHPEAVLIVKALVAPDRRVLDRAIADLVKNKLEADTILECDDIVFFTDYLSDEGMTALLCLADFYVSASMAEGQNLPLIEAMAAGTVPVTTANTAMLDYVDPSVAFVIKDAEVPAPTGHLAGWIAARPFRVSHSRAQDVHDALMRSAAADAHTLAAMSAAGKARVEGIFGHEAIWSKISERLDAIAAPTLPIPP